MNYNIFQRTSSWGYITSEFVFIATRVSFGQYFMQRCVACNDLRDARIALVFGLVIAIAIGAIVTPMTGLAALAYFAGRDPVKCGTLEKYDQIMPYLASQIFRDSPGCTGLFISAAYSATLSTLSTGLNSFSAIVFKTIVKRDIDPTKSILYQRLFMFTLGYVVVLASYSLKLLPDTVVSLVFIVSGGLGGCSAGTFFCGMCFPKINSKGKLLRVQRLNEAKYVCYRNLRWLFCWYNWNGFWYFGDVRI